VAPKKSLKIPKG